MNKASKIIRHEWCIKNNELLIITSDLDRAEKLVEQYTNKRDKLKKEMDYLEEQVKILEKK